MQHNMHIIPKLSLSPALSFNPNCEHISAQRRRHTFAKDAHTRRQLHRDLRRLTGQTWNYPLKRVRREYETRTKNEK